MYVLCSLTMLRISDIIRCLKLEQAIANTQVRELSPKNVAHVVDMFGWEAYVDEVTGETLYRKKQDT